MNILLLNHYAGTPDLGMEFRPYYLAKYWVKKGHNVTIVASSYSHLRVRQPDIKNQIIKLEIIDGINYYWTKGCNYKSNGIWRLINILQYVFYATISIKKLIKNCDIVITSSTYPLDCIIFFIAKFCKSNIKFIYEPHDLWPMVLTEIGGMSKYHPLVLIMSIAEYFSIVYSDAIVSMHPQNILYFRKRTAKKLNFHHIPNGIDLEFQPNLKFQSGDVDNIINLKENGYRIVMYAGSLSDANSPNLLLDLAIEFQVTKVFFVIIGDGPSKSYLQDESRKRKLNVLILNRVPKSQIYSILMHADICLVLFKFSPLYKYGMSANKLWDYMYSGRPVLMSINSSNDPVTDSGCGLTVKTGSISDICKALNQLLSLPDEVLDSMGNKGRSYVISNNSYKKLSDDFLSVAYGIMD